jgi:hypothetical protein
MMSRLFPDYFVYSFGNGASCELVLDGLPFVGHM